MSLSVRYILLKGLSKILCKMSYSRILSMGKFTGPFIMNKIKKQKKRGINQIMTGLSCNQEEAERILQKVYENIGMTFFELLYTPRLVKEKDNINEYVKIDHEEYLKEALKDGKGVIGLTAHFGNWEWMGAGAALHGYKTSAVAKKQDDDIMKLISEFREMSGQVIFTTGGSKYEMIAAARAMKNNYLLGFLADKDGRKTGIPVRFLNRIFSFPQGPAVFASKFKSPILPFFIIRNKSGKGHTICVRKSFYYEHTGDKEKDLRTNSQKMATILEEFIRENPENWMWFQHLFWTEPDEIQRFVNLSEEEKNKMAEGMINAREYTNEK
ncbi:lysophospholipid acyltransferase family protein [Dialister micraerophilus]|uniref:Putative lipid A biosynthesis lauroyl acyltransferase n=1 Tax=Dialister micraerophilus UPII 345-E TaxID=910314 RepID=E4L9W8_9FIRM|nr:lysophospholipid acyltransferase family protein [Dialister micraerophilus]EFR42405.1 putative lipid A biosynthesis lauroyl acyltransferase [Dialister micraerophilus UPII 345-E]